jgi:phosphonate transport system permease protein
MTKYILPNGKKVIQPFNKIWLYIAITAIVIMISLNFIPFNPNTFRPNELTILLERLFLPRLISDPIVLPNLVFRFVGIDIPLTYNIFVQLPLGLYNLITTRDWVSYFSYLFTLGIPIMDTLKMSFAGTIIGSLLAVPLAFLSSSNMSKNKIIYQSARLIMNLIRTIPTIVLAIIATFFVGTGILSGIIAVTIFSFGIMSKMLYESIETIDMGPFEAIESTGANKLKAFRYSVVPEILPIFISFTIYIFEINIRASAILGYVGAGGIGSEIKDNILYNYNRVGAIIIFLLVMILAFQFLSNYLRSKLQ